MKCNDLTSHEITSGPRWPWIANLNFREYHSHFFFFFSGNETENKIIILPCNFEKVTRESHSKSVTTPTIITIPMILFYQIFANTFFDRSSKDNFF